MYKSSVNEKSRVSRVNILLLVEYSRFNRVSR